MYKLRIFPTVIALNGVRNLCALNVFRKTTNFLVLLCEQTYSIIGKNIDGRGIYSWLKKDGKVWSIYAFVSFKKKMYKINHQ